eukprot:6129730-Ditylum_brightwellii.AAC.1
MQTFPQLSSKIQTQEACKNMGDIFADLVKELDMDQEQTFGIHEKTEEGILHVRPGVFGSTDSNNVNLEQ